MRGNIELFSDVMKSLGKNYGIKALRPRQINEIIARLDEILVVVDEPERPVVPDMGLDAWLQTDHVGVSSRFMASVLTGEFESKQGHPLDCDDFERCVGLLTACSALRSGLKTMESQSDEWKAIVGKWDELESLLKQGKREDVDRVIRELVG